MPISRVVTLAALYGAGGSAVGPRGERIMLRFDAATHSAVVWIGETQVVEHEGGYTPFEADVTDLVEPGAEVRITVVVSNVLTWHTIPPGYVQETAGDQDRFAGRSKTHALWSAMRLAREVIK